MAENNVPPLVETHELTRIYGDGEEIRACLRIVISFQAYTPPPMRFRVKRFHNLPKLCSANSCRGRFRYKHEGTVEKQDPVPITRDIR